MAVSHSQRIEACTMARSKQPDRMALPCRLLRCLALSVVLTLTLATHALADKRVALVFGISKYQNVPQLANPDNDAIAISDVFKRIGFDVVQLQQNLGVSEMRR